MRARSIRSPRLRLAPSARKASLLLRGQSGSWAYRLGAAGRGGALALVPSGDVRRVDLRVLGGAVRRLRPRRAGSDRAHDEPTLRPSFPGVRRGGIAEVRHPRALNSCCDAHRERRRSARRFAGRRNGADADHAKDIRGVASPTPARPRRLQSARQHSRWRRLSSRDAGPVRLARVPRRLQCGPTSLRPALGDRPTAAGETRTYVAMLSPMIGGRQVENRAVASFDVVAWARAALFATHSAHSPIAGLSSARVRAVHSPGIRRAVDLTALSPHSEGLFVRLASREREQ